MIASFSIIFLLIITVLQKTKKANQSVSITQYPYISRNKLLSDAERKLYFCLKEIFKDSNIVIFPKVRLLDIVDVLPHSDKTYLWKIQSKHIDFVLCNENDSKILLCLELNDSSHKNQSRIERDVFVSNVLNTVNIPIIFLQVQKCYDPGEVYEKISQYIPYINYRSALKKQENTNPNGVKITSLNVRSFSKS